MSLHLPAIIQGGMGAGVSNWRLARAVSALGQLGVVSGTALDRIMARRLQEGDPGGHVRRALAHFPFPGVAERILSSFYIPGGKPPDAPFRNSPPQVIDGGRSQQELCVAANFVEVFLAREGHSNPVGINYLEKIQLPHLPSLYGAMLAGVAVVIVGAGIPAEMPGVLDRFAMQSPATYPVRVLGAPAGFHEHTSFDPQEFAGGAACPPLQRPLFLPIVSSDALAGILVRKSNGKVNGFVIEGPLAGGHNAPPRGQLQLTPQGEPIYGPRDVVDLAAMRKLGLPFWLAGSYGTAEQVRAARAEGAAGVQVGTAFALCDESGLAPAYKQLLIRKALDGQARVFTDIVASPTGFPFKVAQLEGTLSEAEVYDRRVRVCDLGFLRDAYYRDDGSIGFRCPAEPVTTYVSKGGRLEDTVGRKCLCNALLANIGLPQRRSDGSVEPALVTLGDDFIDVGRFCQPGSPSYTAADVVRLLLS